MRYYIPQQSQQSLGGGWTFIRNFERGMASLGWHRTVSINEADLMLIAGATMTPREEVQQFVDAKKPVVFRVDNIPKDSRNRGTAISRMKDFAEMSNVVVYQSEWAKEYCKPLTGDGMIIYNGVNTKIFNPDHKPKKDIKRYLYVQYNRDENKRFPEAAYHFYKQWKQDTNSQLYLVGRFSPEVASYKFDFWNNENIVHLGIAEEPSRMAFIMRECDVLLFPAFADAAPNTVLEARACGLDVELVNDVGGTKEMLNPDLDISLSRMCEEYNGLFKILLEGTYEQSV